MQKDYVVIFDSGSGGLTILKELLNQNINNDFYYFADNLNAPYGNADRNYLVNHIVSQFKQLAEKIHIKAVILACNTASIVAKRKLEELLEVPIFSISDHILTILEKNPPKPLVLGTHITIESNFFKKHHQNIEQIACEGFAPLIEYGNIDNSLNRSNIIHENLAHVNISHNQTVIFGCTHYPLLEKDIRSLWGNHLTIIDPAITFADSIKNYVQSSDNKFSLIFETTGDITRINKIIKEWIFNRLNAQAQLKMIKAMEIHQQRGDRIPLKE